MGDEVGDEVSGAPAQVDPFVRVMRCLDIWPYEAAVASERVTVLDDPAGAVHEIVFGVPILLRTLSTSVPVQLVPWVVAAKSELSEEPLNEPSVACTMPVNTII